DGLRQYGGRRGAVAGHVSRLGCYLFDHLRAYVLELALKFDLLGDRDAVLSDDGRTETALQQHVAPLGSKGNLDGVSQYVYALDDAGTGVIMKKYVFRTHVCTPVSLKRGSGGLLQGLSVGLNNRQHVVLAHDQILFAIDFDSLSRILAKQDLVAYLERQRLNGAVLQTLAVAHGQNLALLGLLRCGVGDHDAGCRLALLFDSLDDNPVVKRTHIHDRSPF